jgi:hypothetical protein
MDELLQILKEECEMYTLAELLVKCHNLVRKSAHV